MTIRIAITSYQTEEQKLIDEIPIHLYSPIERYISIAGSFKDNKKLYSGRNKCHIYWIHIPDLFEIASSQYIQSIKFNPLDPVILRQFYTLTVDRKYYWVSFNVINYEPFELILKHGNGIYPYAGKDKEEGIDDPVYNFLLSHPDIHLEILEYIQSLCR